MKKRIIVADDDSECSNLLKEFLTDIGYEVVIVRDGASLYRETPKVMPHLIISDLDMPGLSGGTAQALLRVSDKTRSIPIIFITGQPPERQARLVEFRPETKIFQKPLDLKSLALAIEEELSTEW
ncbi:MAG: response regulator [Elusimicrobiota bacterium]